MKEKILCRDLNDFNKIYAHSDDRESIYISKYKYISDMQITSEMEDRLREIAKEEFKKAFEIYRVISDFEAEAEIINLYKTTDKPLYYANIAEMLNLSLKQVVKIVEDLIERGVIEEVT